MLIIYIFLSLSNLFFGNPNSQNTAPFILAPVSKPPVERSADSILGTWENEKMRMEVYKTSNNKYNGRILLAYDPKIQETIVKYPANKEFLSGCKFRGESKTWENGKLRPPTMKRSSAIDATIKLVADNEMEIKASKGIFSKTLVFQRVGKTPKNDLGQGR
ncbi:MAG: hypothetical protein AAFZ15_24730 [Bacteroidota bacterium]